MAQANYSLDESQSAVRYRDVERTAHPSRKRRRAPVAKGSASTLPKDPPVGVDTARTTKDARELSSAKGDSSGESFNSLPEQMPLMKKTKGVVIGEAPSLSRDQETTPSTAGKGKPRSTPNSRSLYEPSGTPFSEDELMGREGSFVGLCLFCFCTRTFLRA